MCLYSSFGCWGLTKRTVDAKLSVKINLLAVHSTMVKRGIGRYMMQVVEVVVKELHYTHVVLTVVSVHKHLVDIYAKWGYQIIGTKTFAEKSHNFKNIKVFITFHDVVRNV
jgi:GNAT superfamily N-acetyltransferase